VLFVLASESTADIRLWPLQFFLMAVLVIVAVYDLYHFVIPNEFVWTLGVVSVVHIAFTLYLKFNWWVLASAALAALAAFGFFAGLWWYSGGKWLGFGDAKLAMPLAALVGLSGVFSMLVFSFWIGAVLSLLLLAYQKYQAKRGQLHLRFAQAPLTIKSEVPFAPFMILGFLVVYLGGYDVLTLFNYVLPF
jgi:leader peptidase (prepilin peptidase)/N-methyltransferase